MILLVAIFTVVIFESNDKTFEIDVYDYTEEPTIEVICPEDIYDCLEPRPKKESISLDDIKDCAENGSYDFI